MRLLAAVTATLCAAAAHAYTLKSPLTAPCHEHITSDAFRQARAATGNAPPIPPTRDEQALIDDVPFAIDEDLRDLGGATLVLAISDNDLKGYSSTDEQQLVPLTADPALQHEHCLRREDQDEPGGSAAALDECRAFIRERVAAALEGLGSDGRPDANLRTELYVYLTIRGARTPAALPTYYVRMAQALHAFEDAFAHSYRTADQRRPTVVLNWSEQQTGRLDERRDGPGHSLALDGCEGVTDFRTLRVQVATQAATELLVATLDLAATPAEKRARTDALLAQYLTLEAGCSFDNGWCDAPEAQLATASAVGCGCAVGGARADAAPGRGALIVVLLVVAAAAAPRLRRAVVLAVVLAGALAWSSLAVAQAPPAAPPTPPQAAPAATAPAATEPGRDTPPLSAQQIEQARRKKRLGPRFGAQLTVAGAIDRAGVAATLGLRFRLTEKWVFGLDGEINPFLGLKDATARPGAFNLYATVVRRYPMTWERVNLRTTVQAGLSTLLFDLYGAPAGSVGPYVGLSILGLDVDLGRALRLVFDPALVTMPVPHVTGQPFYYLQYRVSVGLSFGG